MFYTLSPRQYKTLSHYPDIAYGLAPSRHGAMAVAWWPGDPATPNDPDKVCYLALHADVQKITDHLHQHFPRNTLVRDDARAERFATSFSPGDSHPVLMKSTPFFLQVWETLYNTAVGDTLSYGELASRAGRPKASRAVGQAMATNPVALLVPCHRVLRSQPGKNRLGGYAYGLDVKERLLAAENACL